MVEAVKLFAPMSSVLSLAIFSVVKPVGKAEKPISVLISTPVLAIFPFSRALAELNAKVPPETLPFKTPDKSTVPFVKFSVLPSLVATVKFAPFDTTSFESANETVPLFAEISFVPFATTVELSETTMFPSFADPFTNPEVPFIVIVDFAMLTCAEDSETLLL